MTSILFLGFYPIVKYLYDYLTYIQIHVIPLQVQYIYEVDLVKEHSMM